MRIIDRGRSVSSSALSGSRITTVAVLHELNVAVTSCDRLFDVAAGAFPRTGRWMR